LRVEGPLDEYCIYCIGCIDCIDCILISSSVTPLAKPKIEHPHAYIAASRRSFLVVITRY